MMACVSSAVVPSWGVRGTEPPRGGGTGRSGVPTKLRIISAPPVVFCPPPRGYPRLSSTNNLRVWCEENGELGERILEEWDDPEMGPEEVTRGSTYSARWKCRECGRTLHAQVGHRTRTSSKVRGPSGCKGCLDMVATETHNLKLFCDESGGRLAPLTGCPDCNPPRQTQETDRALAGWRPTPAVAPQTGNCHLRKCTIVERDGKH
jgi:hypothetical protein